MEAERGVERRYLFRPPIFDSSRTNLCRSLSVACTMRSPLVADWWSSKHEDQIGGLFIGRDDAPRPILFYAYSRGDPGSDGVVDCSDGKAGKGSAHLSHRAPSLFDAPANSNNKPTASFPEAALAVPTLRNISESASTQEGLFSGLHVLLVSLVH